MANNIIEQFDEFCSRWNLLDKVGKDMQLGNMMQNVSGLYQFLLQSYARKGFLTQNEANQVRRINQIYQELQAQKIQVDNELWNEMRKHLTKMIIKKSC